MPELPEVETTLAGIKPYIKHCTIKQIIVREHRLRWPITPSLVKDAQGAMVKDIKRRGKYLLIQTDRGTLIIHLGMSGSLRILNKSQIPKKHDHVDIEFIHLKKLSIKSNHKNKANNLIILRLTDPRRFGALLWIPEDPSTHPLIKKLGVEPLEKDFNGLYLWQHAKKRTIPIKSLIMENKIVVGIGNIYATEALFRAHIHPAMPANTLSKNQINTLVKAIKIILRQAIKQGGTTLKDFVDSHGKPGYFYLKLKAYGRNGLPCLRCGKPLSSVIIGQRSSVYCACCQSFKTI